ncbi:MAG: universal stress protein [Sulfuriferula multivorans]|uniref:Universal stress protein n=1 Tax=Sulfuriferula multivorans TaxID=1559896 RepID=A0A7C9JVN5_9PROT|nr:universal stress protein [Sulfuriferula multivorans]
MTPSPSLLAATDFSDPARHALERAAQLATTHSGARLTLTHVISSSMLERLRGLMQDEAPSVQERLLHEAQAALAELATHLGEKHTCPIETLLRQGLALNIIPDLANERQADLLVMGARGAHFVHELLIGSTTERVLRKTRRPLLAVKQRPQSAYRRVLVPVDFSSHAATAARTAHAWLPKAEIVLLHAFGVEMESTLRFAGVAEEQIHEYRARAREAALESMERFIDELAIPPSRLTRLIVHGAPTLQILEHEQSLDIDLIAMGKHGQSALEELLLGSVTKHVLAYSCSDVLVTGHPD